MTASKHDSNKPPLDLVDGLFYRALWGYEPLGRQAQHPEPEQVVDAVFAIDAAESKEALLSAILFAANAVCDRMLDDGETPFRQLVNVLEFGAWKYAPGNWRRGLPRARVYAATLRHVMSRADGNFKDDETGLPHLAHALCELMFFYWYVVKNIDLADDRFTEKEPKPEKAPVVELGNFYTTTGLAAEKFNEECRTKARELAAVDRRLQEETAPRHPPAPYEPEGFVATWAGPLPPESSEK